MNSTTSIKFNHPKTEYNIINFKTGFLIFLSVCIGILFLYFILSNYFKDGGGGMYSGGSIDYEFDIVNIEN